MFCTLIVLKFYAKKIIQAYMLPSRMLLNVIWLIIRTLVGIIFSPKLFPEHPGWVMFRMSGLELNTAVACSDVAAVYQT